MVEQARLLSAALSERGAPDEASVGALLRRLGGRSEARLRVVDLEGRVLGDSSRSGGTRAVGGEAAPAAASEGDMLSGRRTPRAKCPNGSRKAI